MITPNRTVTPSNINSLLSKMEEYHFNFNPEDEDWAKVVMGLDMVTSQNAISVMVDGSANAFLDAFNETRLSSLEKQLNEAPKGACQECSGMTWVMEARGPANLVKPCQKCRPTTHSRWQNSHYSHLGVISDDELEGPGQEGGSLPAALPYRVNEDEQATPEEAQQFLQWIQENTPTDIPIVER